MSTEQNTQPKKAFKPEQKGTKGKFTDTHKRVKNLFSKDEEKALQDVLNKTGLHPKQLVAVHTAKNFVWKVKA